MINQISISSFKTMQQIAKLSPPFEKQTDASEKTIRFISLIKTKALLLQDKDQMPLKPDNSSFGQNQDQRTQQADTKSIHFEEVYGITTLSSKTFIILVTKSHKVGEIRKKQIYKVDQVEFVQIGSTNYQQNLEKHLKQSFCLLFLYYSAYNLTQRLQFSYQVPSFFEHSFCCNYLYTLQYKNYPFQLLTKFIFGFVETKQTIRQGVVYKQTVVSRGNYNHFGRRWFRRGLNQDAYASNHFQTQFILEINEEDKNTQSIYSYLQIRGTIPIIWSQTPNFGLKPETQISSNQEITASLFKQFIQRLQKLEKNVKMVNLISKNGGQQSLGQLFMSHLQRLNPQHTSFTWFDYNKQISLLGKKAFENLMQSFTQQIEKFSFFKVESKLEGYGEKGCQYQKGTFRTNCIDSVDRTNYVQMLFAKIFVIKALQDYHKKGKRLVTPFEPLQVKGLEADFKQLWINNGNQLSVQNSGTKVMKIDNYNEGTRTIGGIMRDFVIGSKRHFIGHFLDYYYQNCLDLHFKKINILQSSQEIQGNSVKAFSLVASITSFFCVPYLSYKLLEKNIKAQNKTQILSIAGSVTLTLAYYLMLRRISGLILQKPINRVQHQ